MKFREGQEAILVGPITNPCFKGPREGSRVKITEAPLRTISALEQMILSGSRNVAYQIDGGWNCLEYQLRPIPDEKPADEDFQKDLKEWLSPEVHHARNASVE